jgi:hypothetical protein
MPSHLKRRVRARMKKTGESYQQALHHLRASADENKPGARSAPATSPSDIEREAALEALSRAGMRFLKPGDSGLLLVERAQDATPTGPLSPPRADHGTRGTPEP